MLLEIIIFLEKKIAGAMFNVNINYVNILDRKIFRGIIIKALLNPKAELLQLFTQC